MKQLTGSQKKIFAVTTVLIIAIAGIIGVYTLTKNEDNKGADNINSELMICGNSNNDYTINDDDLQIIQDIINKDKTLSEYPLADANADGTVDSKDVELVQKIIDREDTTLYIVCLDPNGNEAKIAVSYPLKNAVTYGTNIVEPTLNVGGGKYCAGYFSSTYPVAEVAFTKYGAVDLKGSSRIISDAAWQNFINLDASLQSSGGIGALLVDYSGIGALTDSYLEDLKDANIPIIAYASADASIEMSTALTLGFLFGTDCEKTGLDYARLSWDVINQINEKISSLNESDMKTYICLTMGTYICQNDSTFNISPKYAGGVPYYTVNSEFAAAYTGASSVKMQSVEALSNYGDADTIISNRSIDYGVTDMNSIYVSEWEKYMSYFENLDNYENLVYVNNLLPGGCKIAYMAHILYPDLFSIEWANSIMQEFIDEFEPFEGHTLEDIIAFFTYEDYISAKNSSA